MSSDDSVETRIKNLLRDLEIPDLEKDFFSTEAFLDHEFAGFLALGEGQFKEIGLDLCVFVGMSGDWQLSLQMIQKILKDEFSSNLPKLWKLRCLVELKKNAEALALGSSTKWSKDDQIHVNYLTGLAFESLGLKEQARLRFDSVYKVNSSYRGVAQKLLTH